MTIYLAFLQSKIQHQIPAYSFWEYYIKNGIEEAGYKWAEGEVDWAEGLVNTLDKKKLAKWKTVTWEKTVTDIKLKHNKKPITFFLSYLYPHQVEEQAIKEIQKIGIPCINFFCDNVREYTNIPKEFGIFDLNWVPEYKAIKMYKKANYPNINLPMPMWVHPKHRNLTPIQNDDISFIGSKDVQRWLLFEELSKQSLNLNIYGTGWQNQDSLDNEYLSPKKNITLTLKNQFAFLTKFGTKAYIRKLQQRNLQLSNSINLQKYLKGKPNFEEYISITQQSAITLGVNSYPSFNYTLNKPNTYSRLRDIEAPMLGACYLTQYTEGLEFMYDLGSEIEVYYSNTDLIEKIDALKINKVKRDKLRLMGQKKALSVHCIINSINKVADYFDKKTN